jgi:hypothetical protein
MEDEVKMPINVPKLFYRMLFVGGIVFYISWLAVFGAEHWNDVGVYAITVVLIGFGLVGSWLYDEIEKRDRQSDRNGE